MLALAGVNSNELNMKKTILILSLLTSSFCMEGQNEIKIQFEKLYPQNQLGISEFYFVHQTFADAFFMTDLYKQLNYDEMTDILKKVYYGVTKDDKVVVNIEQDKGPKARLVFSVLTDNKDGDIYILATNFNNKTRRFESRTDDKESIVRWYFIRNEKLVYRQDLYSKKEERKRLKEEQHSIIDYYLFDNSSENDSKIKKLIDNLLDSDESEVETLYAHLYLGEYWLLNDNLDNAETSVEQLELFFNNSKTISKGYSLIVNMAKTELEIMKRIKR